MQTREVSSSSKFWTMCCDCVPFADSIDSFVIGQSLNLSNLVCVNPLLPIFAAYIDHAVAEKHFGRETVRSPRNQRQMAEHAAGSPAHPRSS